MRHQLGVPFLEQAHVVVDDLVIEPGVGLETVEDPSRDRDIEGRHDHLLVLRITQHLLHQVAQRILRHEPPVHLRLRCRRGAVRCRLFGVGAQ